MGYKPVVWLSGAFVIGIAGTLFGITGWPWLLGAGLVTFLLFQSSNTKHLALLAVVCLLGVAYTHFWQSVELVDTDKWVGSSVQGVAQVVDDPTIKQDTVTIPVKVFTTEPSQFNGKRFLIKAKVGAEEIGYGQWFSFSGTLLKTAAPLNPGEFDYGRYLRYKGINGQIFVSGEGGLKVVKSTLGNPLFYLAIKIKHHLAENIENAVGSQWSGLVQGMLLGGRQGIEETVLEDFNRIGLVHILSVSGFQVALILVALQKTGEWFGLAERSKLGLVILGIGGYCLITGMEASVVRAGIMAVFAVVGKTLNRHKDWASALAIAALILVVNRPTVLSEPGFQLSFIATWTILYIFPVLDGGLQQLGWSPWLRSTLGLPVAVQVGTWPIIAYHFNTFSWLSILGNTLLAWLVVPITWVGIAGLVCSGLVGLVGQELLQLATLGTQWLVAGANLLAQIPWGNYHVASPAPWLVLAYFVLLVAYVTYLTQRNWRIRVRGLIWRNEKLVVGALVLTLLIKSSMMLLTSSPLEVTFLAVGQGDALVIKTPDGKAILLDTGGKSPGGERTDPGARVVVPYLKSQGIDRLDGIILSHPDGDHINGLTAVIKSFPDTKVWVSPYFGQQPLGQQYLRELNNNKIPVHTLQGGHQLKLADQVYLKVLQPYQGNEVASDSDSNNNSLVLKLTYGARSFVFTGDAEAEALQTLVSRASMTTDVLKVPHHGAKSSFSPEAYESIFLKYAVVSVGKNMFGHPRPEVLEYLNTRAQQVWQTNLDGAITIQTDGQKMWFSSYKGGKISGL